MPPGASSGRCASFDRGTRAGGRPGPPGRLGEGDRSVQEAASVSNEQLGVLEQRAMAGVRIQDELSGRVIRCLPALSEWPLKGLRLSGPPLPPARVRVAVD